MNRWHAELSITRRRWNEHRLMHVENNKDSSVGPGPGQRPSGADPREIKCACDNQPGRFRKRNAYDCGRPRCFVCHGHKFPKREPTRQERVAHLEFDEQVHELFNGE